MTTNTKTAGKTSGKMSVRTMVAVGMLGAIAVILMMVDIPLWFAPSFYQLDLSEVPILVGTFAFGPAAGALIELIKVLLHLVLNGTTTAGVGDFANFLIGCALVVPAGLIYKRKKSKKNAALGLAVGTLVMTVLGCFLNIYVLLPVYAAAFNMPMEALVGMGTAVNPAITNLTTFALLAVAPFNLLKGVVVSVLTVLLYKHISPILKNN